MLVKSATFAVMDFAEKIDSRCAWFCRSAASAGGAAWVRFEALAAVAAAAA